MKYKDFVRWCNRRACDGCWGYATCIVCIAIMNEMKSVPFYKRNKLWRELRADVEEKVVKPINELIEKSRSEDI